MNAVELFLAVVDIGGWMAPVDGGRLRVLLPADCPPDLRNAICDNKPLLLAFLSGPQFIVVRSEILPPLLFWTAAHQGRDLLVAHGAPPELIYTRDELAAIARTNPDARSLMLLHQCKRLFGSRFFSTEF